MKKTKASLPRALALLAALLLAGVFHLAYFFPKTMEVWDEEGRPISVLQQMFVNLSSLCQSIGILLIPVLFFAVVGCTVWAMRVSDGHK